MSLPGPWGHLWIGPALPHPWDCAGHLKGTWRLWKLHFRCLPYPSGACSLVRGKAGIWTTKTWLLMNKSRWVISKLSPHIKKIQFKERKIQWANDLGHLGWDFPEISCAIYLLRLEETGNLWYVLDILLSLPASQFSTFPHWLRLEMSENWKAMDKKNNMRDSQRGKSTEEEMTPFRALVGTLLPLGLVQRLGLFTDSQKKKGPKMIHS